MHHISLPDAEATAALARALGACLRPGDMVALHGPLGAGKSHFARALIAGRLADAGRAEDIPSPTYTLVQSYETGRGEIWHADLYRLSEPFEAVELGLVDALPGAVLLVEWADRLGPLLPPRRLDLTLAIESDTGRTATLSPRGTDWHHLRPALSRLAEAS